MVARSWSWFQTSSHVGLHFTNRCHACLHAASGALFPLSSTSAVGLDGRQRLACPDMSTVQLQSYLPQLHFCITVSISPPPFEPAPAPDKTSSIPKLRVLALRRSRYPIPPADEVKTKDDEYPLASQVQVHIPFQCFHRA